MAETTKKIALQTLGCRLNQYETEKMAAELYPFGFRRAEPGEKADLYIINTCTVTHRADSDCRQMVKKAARENPNGKVVVAGCYVDNDPALIGGISGVHVLIKNKEKERIASILPSQLPDLFDREPDSSCSTNITDFHGHNRAWLKVSDGCNQWCSFCIIPTVRGRLRNRPVNDIVSEVSSLVANGYNEIVLTGVHLGHYKNRQTEPQAKNLASLCRMILDRTEVKRIRLSSIEPQTVREELVQVYAESAGRICRHMHIPLQSGSSRILKLMQRPYDQNTYIKRVTAVKEAQPNTIVGADVIVGFPGETDADFGQTKRLAESGLIDYLHVFSYSDRPGTPASQMSDKISPEVIKERNAILSEISERNRAKAHLRQVGERLEVIAEHRKPHDREFFGVADNFIKVKLSWEIDGGKRLIPIRVTAACDEFVVGMVEN
ncbi:MAG: tRNA (N(6)-L-threonylcarbamoyladenosine(37)-C(2))-methylthiotransferase MtaB [candidate division Zixibacteria bacterium]|nr:tRNA (N(6)-L-threonylcarbamoyladenosine(37)-C(2))-methylthiotransferase MtaB [candidate division Zixibacteria bacterium]